MQRGVSKYSEIEKKTHVVQEVTGKPIREFREEIFQNSQGRPMGIQEGPSEMENMTV